MTESHLLSRRAALKFGATVAALPLVHIRTTGAAGKLKVALGSSLVPGADDAMRKLIGQWAAQTKTEVEASFLSYTTNQIVMTVAAESQARTGHDVVGLAYAGPITYAHLLEPVDDVVRRLQQKYGPTNETIEYVGKVEGHWAAVPANVLGNLLPCCGRIDVFKQQLGMDLQQTFPAKPEMGPGYDQWTWDAFQLAAERCAKAGMPFGLPISACDDAQAWLGGLFRSYGAELLDAAGNVTVDSDAVRAVLEYLKRLTPYLPDSVYSWDNASNNRALVGGHSALILNPPSAWAQAAKDRPQVGSQCWHFPPPVGPKGRFINYFPQFWGIWQFGTNKSAAKELVEWLSQRERAELICTADYGFDIPPFLSMNEFKVWEEAGPPAGTLFNYPIKPAHHATATLPTYPAPLGLMAPIYGLAVLPNMVARVTRSARSIEETIAWAQGELESLKS